MFSRIVSLGVRRQLLFAQPRVQFRPLQWMKQQKVNGYIKRLNSTIAKPQPPVAKEKGIKVLIKQYGYSALAVYLLLSCLDYPLCFVVVHQVGVEKVLEYQALIKQKVKEFIGYSSDKEDEVKRTSDEEKSASEENEEKKEGSRFWESPLFTEAIVAYAVHKSLIFIRLPITAAITPSFVSLLKRWGFKIGTQSMSTIAQQAAAKTTQKVVDKVYANASNPKFGTSPAKSKRWWNLFF